MLAIGQPAPPILLVSEDLDVIRTVLAGVYDLFGFDAPPNAQEARGRQVLIWGTRSETSAALAATMLPCASSVGVVDASADGWPSPGNVLIERLTAASLVEWLRARCQAVATDRKTRVGRPHSGGAPVETVQPESASSSLQSMPLECNSKGLPEPTITNVAVILTHHPRYRGHIWFDDFRRKIMFDAEGGARPWNDSDDLAVLAFINNTLLLSKIGLMTTTNAVHMAAFMNRRNSVLDYLNGLTWDGTERLSHWVADYLGCPNTPYTQAAGSNWLISMVARAFRPGCQADHMPVLEGLSGRGKSSALAILGGEWYRAAPQAFGSKEFFEVIQGAWLVEIPDMVGFGRREHSQIISAITTRSDSYRASYGRHAEDHPRTVIFVATSETDEYLQDSRGVRRYWPLRCAEIDTAGLAAVRDQLFAEAIMEFKRGATWHEMPAEETRNEQEARQELDPWMDRIAQFCASREKVVVTEVLDLCLEIETQKRTRIEQMRVAKCLQRLGLICKLERVGLTVQRVYRRP
jgi:predicted P-loop ATPase